MRPDRIKMFRALEDANPDVGAMVDEIPAPDGDAMVFEEGIDLTDVPAPAAAPPVVAQAPTLPEYDATADKAALARAQAADSERNAARALIQGVHQMGASLAGGPVTQTTLAPGTAEAKAMAAADKNKADAKARRVEALRLLEMGEATKRSTASLAAAEARAKAAQAEADRRAKEQREYQIGENEKMRTAAMERAQVMAGREIAREERGETRKIETEQRKATADQAKAARDIEGFAVEADRALDEIADIVRKNGTFELTGPSGAALEDAVTSYATSLAKLRDPGSVAREGEVALARRGLFEPGVKGLATSNRTALEIVRRAKERMAERRADAYKVRGIEAPKKNQTTDENAAALKWAKEHPDDPRAAAILEALK